MSTEDGTPPAIAPKVVTPRPVSPGPGSPPPPPLPPDEFTYSPDVAAASGSTDFAEVNHDTQVMPVSVELDEETAKGMERSSGASTVSVARLDAAKAAEEAIAAAKVARTKVAVPSSPEAVLDDSTVPRAEISDPVVVTPLGTESSAPTAPLPTSAFAVAGAASTAPPAAMPPVSTMRSPAMQPPASTAPSPDTSPLLPSQTYPEPAEAAQPSSPPPASVGPSSDVPRTIRLAIAKVSPWSVMKMAFLLALAGGVMLVVAVIVIWLVLDGLQVFSKIGDFVGQVVVDKAQKDEILGFFDFSRVVSQATIIAVVNVVLWTFLATLGSVLYNITAALVGGLRMTLTDE